MSFSSVEVIETIPRLVVSIKRESIFNVWHYTDDILNARERTSFGHNFIFETAKTIFKFVHV